MGVSVVVVEVGALAVSASWLVQVNVLKFDGTQSTNGGRGRYIVCHGECEAGYLYHVCC